MDIPSNIIGRKRKRDQPEEGSCIHPRSCETNELGWLAAHEAGSDHTGSQTNMKLAHLWIENCRQNHDTCKISKSSGSTAFRPSRLIDVRNPKRPFLWETKPGVEIDYVALSYAWGEGKKLVSNKDNFENHKHSIPEASLPREALPKTFADAFETTRLLGYQHIWVNALCIKQDDGDDLQRELPKMGDIYRYAMFTIFAEGAPNARAGLFQSRDPYIYQPCTVDVTLTMEQGVTSDKLTLATICTGHNHLKARGWVLQEEVFTSRSLLFGKQMSWMCTASEASETRPYPMPRKNALKEGLATAEDKLRLWLLRPTQMLDTPRKGWFRWNQYDAWYAIVERYSYRELSYDSDKLPALSGLAGLFHQSHGSTYAAGLWRDDLQLGLAWYVASNDPRPVRRDRREGPSWSWASVGMVRLKFRSWKSNSSHIVSAGAKILDVSCVLDHPANPYGRVRKGTLELRTPIHKAVLRWDSIYLVNRTEYSYGSYSGPDSSTMTKGEHPRFPGLVFNPDSSYIGEAALDAPIHAGLDTGIDEFGFTRDEDKENEGSFEMEVWCALLHVQKTATDCRLSALVLEKTHPDAKNYRRLGLLFVKDCSLEDLPLPGWQEKAIVIC